MKYKENLKMKQTSVLPTSCFLFHCGICCNITRGWNALMTQHGERKNIKIYIRKTSKRKLTSISSLPLCGFFHHQNGDQEKYVKNTFIWNCSTPMLKRLLQGHPVVARQNEYGNKTVHQYVRYILFNCDRLS